MFFNPFISRTWPYEAKTEDNDVTVLDVEEEDSLEDLEEDGGQLNFTTYRGAGEGGQPRAKLLQFHLNQRPAYWGTWTKTSSKVGLWFSRGRFRILDHHGNFKWGIGKGVELA